MLNTLVQIADLNASEAFDYEHAAPGTTVHPFSSRQGSGSYFRYFFSNSAAFFIWMGSGLFSMHSYSSTRTPTGALKTAPVT